MILCAFCLCKFFSYYELSDQIYTFIAVLLKRSNFCSSSMGLLLLDCVGFGELLEIKRFELMIMLINACVFFFFFFLMALVRGGLYSRGCMHEGIFVISFTD